jgi:hypothetical protein
MIYCELNECETEESGICKGCDENMSDDDGVDCDYCEKIPEHDDCQDR